MIALRYVGLLALTVWLGGMVALGGITAPAVFDVLDADGRAVAGDLIAEILRRFHLVAYAAGALVLGCLIVRALIGPRPVRFWIRTTLAALMLLVAIGSGVIVSGRLERLRREIGVSPGRLSPADARRATFDRLHTLSTVLMGLNVAGGLALLYWEAQD